MYGAKAVLFFAVVAVNAQAVSPGCADDCPNYTLAFSDEFTNAIDTSVWIYRSDATAASAQVQGNVGTSNGALQLTLKKELVVQAGKTWNYTGAGIISKENFQYGYYEARMQMFKVVGGHASFWNMAGDGSTTVNSAYSPWTEIDTLEVNYGPVKGVNQFQPKNTVLNWSDTSAGDQKYTSHTTGYVATTDDLSAAYHTYGSLWNETHVTFYRDGNKTFTVNYPPSVYPHDYLNIWVTNVVMPGTVDSSVMPCSVNIDYVRYFQRDYYLTASSLCRSRAQGTAKCPSNENYRETGTWTQSSLDGYNYALPSRYSNSKGNTASWSQTVPVAGTYDISAWIIAKSGSDPTATYNVTGNGVEINSLTVDQTKGPSAWVSLASNVQIGANETIEVVLGASGKGYTRSDAVKIVRVA